MTCAGASSTVTRTRGDDWTVVGTLGGSGDITGATVTSQIRTHVESSTVVASWTATVTDGPGREVTLSLSDTLTAAITPGRYVYDVQVVAGGVTTTYPGGGDDRFEGRAVLIVQGDVTR
jgi:hypothetical protein